MMVITHNFVIDCKHCSSTIRYNSIDIRKRDIGMYGSFKYITCPTCKERIRVGGATHENNRRG